MSTTMVGRGIRCLTCVVRDGHASWCPDNVAMEAIQMPVERPVERSGVPAWAAWCIVFGALLMVFSGTALLSMGVGLS